ncbi:MAG: hypothetical protein QOD45_1316 [Pseudonocardiales bacterium]|jgi:hypothetical protein|nr:hypothetical protein [Pseudonocardiales bacterium]
MGGEAWEVTQLRSRGRNVTTRNPLDTALGRVVGAQTVVLVRR